MIRKIRVGDQEKQIKEVRLEEQLVEGRQIIAEKIGIIHVDDFYVAFINFSDDN